MVTSLGGRPRPGADRRWGRTAGAPLMDAKSMNHKVLVGTSGGKERARLRAGEERQGGAGAKVPGQSWLRALQDGKAGGQATGRMKPKVRGLWAMAGRRLGSFSSLEFRDQLITVGALMILWPLLGGDVSSLFKALSDSLQVSHSVVHLLISKHLQSQLCWGWGETWPPTSRRGSVMGVGRRGQQRV